MSFKKKLAVTTIAASVAMSAFAGIPLSNKGLAEKLGVSNVVQAAAYADFITDVNKVYAELVKIEGGVNAVSAVKDRIDVLLSNGTVDVAPIALKLSNNKPELAAEFENLLKGLIRLPITSDWETVYKNEYRTNYNGLLTKVSNEYGLESKLTADDLGAVLLEFEKRLVTLGIDSLATKEDAIKAAADEAIATNAKVKKLADDSGLKAADLSSLYNDLLKNIDAGTAFTGFSALRNAFKAAFPAPPTTTPSDPGPVFVGGGFPSSSLPLDAENAVKSLESLKAKLADATDAQKAELIAQAVKDAQAAVDKISTVNSTTSVSNNQATLSVNENNALSAIKGIVAIANSLKNVTGEVLPAITLTIDFGGVTQDELIIKLPAAVVNASADAKLSGIAVKAGKFAVKVPVGGEITGAVELNVKQAAPSAELAEQAKFVSKVFDFNLTVNSIETKTIPGLLKVTFPVDNAVGIDTELLTVVRINEGSLQYFGGRYDRETATISELRDTLSSYAVVENNVSFGDTSTVEDWAGRAIQVIAAKGAINGKAEGVFAPQDQVTRAEFAKMLIHALDLDNVSAKAAFGDVGANDWFAPYVAAAADLGVINGRSANRFDPQAKITRAEMATMVARALKTKGATAIEDLDAELAIFSDAGQISSSLKEGVAFAAHHGIVIGNDGKFSPNSNATRAQAAVIIYRAFKF